MPPKKPPLEGKFFPRHFGAKANGISNDTAAVQQAIFAAWDIGGVVAFECGDYVLDVLTLPWARSKAVALVGANSTYVSAAGCGTRLAFTGKAQTAIEVLSTEFAVPTYRLENLTLLGPGTDSNGLVLSGAAVPKVLARNVYVYGFGGVGVHLDNVENSTLQDVWAHKCGVGFKLTGAFNGNVLINPNVQLCARGMEIQDSTSCAVHGGVVQSNERDGVFGTGMIDWVWNATHFENNAYENPGTGYAINLETSPTRSVQHVHFNACTFFGANERIRLGATLSQPGVQQGIKGVTFNGGYALGGQWPIEVSAVCQGTRFYEFCLPAAVHNLGIGTTFIWNGVHTGHLMFVSHPDGLRSP